MIFAVGTDHDVILYDTQQRLPFARFQEIHYTRMTDLTWSSDGLLLVASSTDGFCALITFEPQELGLPYVKEDSEKEDSTLDVSITEEVVEKDENIDINNSTVEADSKESEPDKKRHSFIEKWALNPPHKRLKPNPVIENSLTKNDIVTIESAKSPLKENPLIDKTDTLNKNGDIAKSPPKENSLTSKIEVPKNSPKRITPICLSNKSPKRLKSTTLSVPSGTVDLTKDSPVKSKDDGQKCIPPTPKRIAPTLLRKGHSDIKNYFNKDSQNLPRRITPILVKASTSNEKEKKEAKADVEVTESNNSEIILIPDSPEENPENRVT